MVSSDPPRLKVTVEGGTAPAAEFLFENWFRIGRHTNCQVQLVGPEVTDAPEAALPDRGLTSPRAILTIFTMIPTRRRSVSIRRRPPSHRHAKS